LNAPHVSEVSTSATAARRLRIVRNEIANTVTHGIGLALSIAGVALLL
jgi:predicted membrane channel-forming protein YqfA (hemolysin III family)